MKYALISVYKKDNLVDFANKLRDANFTILASGGTANLLEENSLSVIRIEKFTGQKEILGGRVKTLHPKIHGGILADRNSDAHMKQLDKNKMFPIDLVVCNLYPFTDRLADGADHETMIETIDIGGPTLIRAAAKNADGGVAVVCDPNDYQTVIDNLNKFGEITLETRRTLAAKAFRQIAVYDLAIAGWYEEEAGIDNKDGLPLSLPNFSYSHQLRYGENPHQKAAIYTEQGASSGVGIGVKLSGKDLSYTNYLDLDGAYRSAQSPRDIHCCSIIKHTNPCGLAEDASQSNAFNRALNEGDSVSAFGSIIGFNKAFEVETAQAIKDSKLFVECIVAPKIPKEARAVLKAKKDLRLVEVSGGDPNPKFTMHRIGAGMLVQEVDTGISNINDWKCVTEKQLELGWLEQLQFAMRATAVLKSNAIAITKNNALIGFGTGQTSRVDSTEHAIKKAGDAVEGSFMGSDAFFPFDDCVRLAAKAGVVAIIQPGGSKRDQDSIDACNELGLAMVFTGYRHFKH